jgi:hypothetical protein
MPNNKVSLRELFLSKQSELEAALRTSRIVIPHQGEKGAVTELHWLEMLDSHLPKRYKVRRGFVIDATGAMSDQIDLIIHDAQYSPLLFEQGETCYVPAESVYGIFEVKQEISKETIEYAGAKAASVRKLRRTSAPIYHAGGMYPPRDPPPILAGLLAFEASWTPPFGGPFEKALKALGDGEALDIGCALRHGSFQPVRNEDGETTIAVSDPEVALVTYFLGLLALLQRLGTVPAMDLAEYQQTALG